MMNANVIISNTFILKILTISILFHVLNSICLVSQILPHSMYFSIFFFYICHLSCMYMCNSHLTFHLFGFSHYARWRPMYCVFREFGILLTSVLGYSLKSILCLYFLAMHLVLSDSVCLFVTRQPIILFIFHNFTLLFLCIKRISVKVLILFSLLCLFGYDIWLFFPQEEYRMIRNGDSQLSNERNKC